VVAERGEVLVAGLVVRQAYPGVELTEAWKKALFNDFHDVAAGSSLGIIYKDAQRDYDQVRWATEEASSQALEAIDARIDTRGTGVPILVWNPLGWSRSGVASVEVQMPQASESGISVIDAQGSLSCCRCWPRTTQPEPTRYWSSH